MSLFATSLRLLLVLTLAILTGCTTTYPWPADLPAHTYRGVVINAALGTPLAGVTLRAYRPNEQKPPLSYESIGTEQIGETTSGADGSFTLRTQTGYADTLSGDSADGKFVGSMKLPSHDADGLRFVLVPGIGGTTIGERYRLSPEDSVAARAAIGQIVNHAAAHPHEPLLSLDGYAARGIISPAARDVFARNGRQFFGPRPAVDYSFGPKFFLIRDTHHPLTLREANGDDRGGG